MSSRRYRLRCPIARALDRIGDRWTLLLLRDLQAGPARFSELAQGLAGIASNLLVSRLEQLQRDGLVLKRPAALNVSVYELTDIGAATGDLLYALADYGARFAPDDEARRPGNMRSLANTLRVACQLVAEPSISLRGMLIVDGERLALDVDQGAVSVRYGAVEGDLDVIVATDYEALLQVVDGVMSAEAFAQHLEVLAGEPPAAQALLALVSSALGERAARLAASTAER